MTEVCFLQVCGHTTQTPSHSGSTVALPLGPRVAGNQWEGGGGRGAPESSRGLLGHIDAAHTGTHMGRRKLVQYGNACTQRTLSITAVPEVNGA